MRTPGLGRLAVWPLLINILLTVVVPAGVAAFGYGYAILIEPRFAEGGWGIVWRILIGGVAIVLCAAVVVFLWCFVQDLVGRAAERPLVERAAEVLAGDDAALHELPARRSLADAIRNVVTLSAIYLGFLIQACVPVLGTIFGVFGALYCGCFKLGNKAFDTVLDLHGVPGKQRREYYKVHRPETIGLGLASLLGLFVPLAGAVFLTTATIGAIVLYRGHARRPAT